MKKQTSENIRSFITLTVESLQRLKEKGFHYVQVKGVTMDNRLDYMEPHYLMLVPMKNLPEDPSQKDVYTSIDSNILLDWANSPNRGIKVVIAPFK
ncbi:MAG: hypothetical protein JST87_18005 [Bacteroidetes bacterium]|nr:hypothetical protein [Bacteroidota bacterium]